MIRQEQPEFLSRAAFETQLQSLAQQLGSVAFDCAVVLAVSGMPTAEITGNNTVAISTYEENGEYYMGDFVRLKRFVTSQDGDKQRVRVGDNSTNRNELLPYVAQHVLDLGGIPTTYACIARELQPDSKGQLPDYVAGMCPGKPIEPYWKYQSLVPGVRDIAQYIKQLGWNSQPDRLRLLAVGANAYTGTAELAKQLTISGRFTGGLPTDTDGKPDTSWAELSDCEGKRVIMLGQPGADLADAATLVRDRKGIPQPFTLPV